jgi:hypothetical protein
VSASFNSAKTESKPSSDDFDFDDNFTSTPKVTTAAAESEDDFFNDL